MSAPPTPLRPQQQSHKFAFAMITSLFFMWGFVHNLDPILIPHLKRAFSLTVLQSSLIDSAVFLAYFFMALPAGYLIRKAGFKNTIVVGLLLFAGGCFLFIPAANTQQYALFLGALFIIACGLTMLETAANPYATLLGTPERASFRLNLAQSFNGLAASLAPIIGARVILVQGASEQELQAMSAGARQMALAAEAASVKLPYLVLGLVIVVIAVIFQRLKMPEIHQARDLADAAPAAPRRGIGQAWRCAPVRRAVIAQFFYVGAQVSVFSFFILYATRAAGLGNVAAADYLGWGCGTAFMVGRFAGTFFMRFVAPARLLLVYAIACVALSLAAMLGSGMIAVYAVIGIAFFMSIMFPTIFSLGIRDAGPDTEMGSSLIIMSIIGGALLPLLFGAISDATGNIQHGYAVPLLCFAVTAWFARATLAQPAVAAPMPTTLERSTAQHV
jgi:MFS transporter, FHS family, L-fucose permease